MREGSQYKLPKLKPQCREYLQAAVLGAGQHAARLHFRVVTLAMLELAPYPNASWRDLWGLAARACYLK